MRRTTVLRHDLPNGHGHVDWLVQAAEGRDSPVLAFRLSAGADVPRLLLFSAERLPDHRAFYLDHSGEVSGGRGTVAPMSRGVVLDVQPRGDSIALHVDFGAGGVWLVGRAVGGGRWIFERVPAPPES